MKRVLTAWFLVGAIVLGSCESGLNKRYLDASVGGTLELPPDLSEYEAESRFELPEGFAGDDPSVRNRVPVLANVDTMRLEGSADMYWLSVDEPVANLYQLVKNFWSSEGYQLTLDEPVIGVMQTEWILKEQGAVEDQGWFESLFSGSNLTASQDQFKTRIERGDGGRNRIYIAHRGSEYVYKLEVGDNADSAAAAAAQIAGDDEDNQWRFRQPEPELEIEMLSRLMIYLGLQKAQVEAQVENVKLFEPRAFMYVDSEENSPFLLLKDAYQVAWNRVYHQLERMNFEIVTSEFDSGLFNEGFFIVNTEVVKEDDDKGGFFSWFSSSDDEPRQRQVVLVVLEETHEVTRVNIETADGEFDTSPEANQFLKLLYQQIK